MRRVILKNYQSPGDILMLTAAVRELAVAHRERFQIDVRTSCPALWENNPHIAPLDETDPSVTVLTCHYPLIQFSNQRPYHFIHAFIQYLSERLEVPLWPTAFRGDVHLSEEERRSTLPEAWVPELQRPMWIVVAGGKMDFTIKWWSHPRFQQIIDYFRGRITFVQVGATEHHHLPLDGVIDLRGRTSLRDLVLLMHHADGVLCPVTFLMHLSAAVPSKKSGKYDRPCIVIAGGREPPHWEAYPNHQFMHSVGALPCCSEGGCWKSRTVPVGDGDEKDLPQSLCEDVVDGPLPHCMDLIEAEDVVRRIEIYLAHFESKRERSLSLRAELPYGNMQSLTEKNALTAIEEQIRQIPRYDGTDCGRGIVICGGGIKYFVNAWVCIQMLRLHSCRLPIQLWYLGDEELDERMRSLVAPYGVVCIDALEVRKKRPARILNGWELKPYAILNCGFNEVLLLDADNVPVRDPSFLFETKEYQEHGAAFWPDFSYLQPTRKIWSLCGIEYRHEPEFETGQIVVNKERCWEALRLTMWINEFSDFFYRYVHGDKETFHIAFLKLGLKYSMPSRPIFSLPGVMCQHDFQGRRLFQHRNLEKWSFFDRNPRIEGFQYEAECIAFLRQLKDKWDGRILPSPSTRTAMVKVGKEYEEIVSCAFTYRRLGHDSRRMCFDPDGFVGVGAAACERFWRLLVIDGELALEIHGESGLTCRMMRCPDGRWRGRWVVHERMDVELTALGK